MDSKVKRLQDGIFDVDDLFFFGQLRPHLVVELQCG